MHPRRDFRNAVIAIAMVALLLASIGVAIAQTPPPEKRTVYLIGNLSAAFRFPLVAYVIVDDQLFMADTWQATNRDSGPVGLAIDETNENLFVSYENGAEIEVFDARDATPLGTIPLYGTSDLAGMVVHQDRGHLYVVDRGMTDIFVYDTTTFSQLDHWTLPTGTAWGIDLLGNQLWVTGSNYNVNVFDIDAQTLVSTYTLTVPSIGIAVTDYPELQFFITGFTGTQALHPFVVRYTVSTGVEDKLALGSDTKGVTVNPASELVYAVADNKLHIIDYSSTLAVLDTINLNFTWTPTDTLASFVPFGGTVKKTCTSHPNGKIYKGDTVNFKIEIQNRHPLPIHKMSVNDVYDNTQLHFVSASPVTDDNVDDGEVNWADLIAQIGQDLPTGDWAQIDVTFTALEDCELEVEGINTASMYDVEDTEGTALPDASGQFEYTINCKCRTNLDCDNGQFCDGQETCDTQTGDCISPGNPCPLDDSLWCNGDETEECDEELDECGHENEPCEDDGVYCNGQEICNEDNDTCTNAGDPCADDSQFCNGDESCDEDNDTCLHSGDPCNPGEECNEAEDSCTDMSPSDDDDDDTPEDDEDLWPKGKVTGGCCGCD